MCYAQWLRVRSSRVQEMLFSKCGSVSRVQGLFQAMEIYQCRTFLYNIQVQRTCSILMPYLVANAIHIFRRSVFRVHWQDAGCSCSLMSEMELHKPRSHAHHPPLRPFYFIPTTCADGDPGECAKKSWFGLPKLKIARSSSVTPHAVASELL